MTTVQERIKALGLNKVSRAGGKRVTKKKSRVTLEQKLENMIKDGKPVPKHLAKKAEQMLKDIKLPESVEVAPDENDDLPAFEMQSSRVEEIGVDDDNEDIPDLETFETPDLDNVVVL